MNPCLRTLLFCIQLLCLLLLCFSCSSSGQSDPDSDTSHGQQTSSDSGQDTGDSDTNIKDSVTGNSKEDSLATDACDVGTFNCDRDILMRCDNGKWQAWNDCTVTNARCTVVFGEYKCVGETATEDTENTDTDTATDDTRDTQSNDTDDTSVHTDTSDTATDTSDTATDTSDTATDTSDTATDTSGHDETTDSATVTETDVFEGTDSVTDGTDSGTDASQCDGDGVDCYEECWDCALETPICKPKVTACMADNNCKTYYDCKEAVCCQGTNDCLTGEAWLDCLATCRADNHISDGAVELFDAIDTCVACTVCEQSCAHNLWDEWSRCADPEDMNTIDTPCYADEAEKGEYSCFSWAGWGGGPCTQKVNTCKSNPACVALELCVNESWSDDLWMEIQDECFADAGPVAQAAYWDYMQCIYCDACDRACLKDAGSKNCEEYNK
ncbi:MAG: hypothetical protein JXX14_14110 [Deltaproteobacteria bacterium]|nr:hypothetical protein [Deltaproteobacteria bacterium]